MKLPNLSLKIVPTEKAFEVVFKLLYFLPYFIIDRIDG